MTQEEFSHGFVKLTSAFSVNRPQDKARIYFEELTGLESNAWKKTVNRLLRSAAKFPTIKEILDTSQGFIHAKTQEGDRHCRSCDGYGGVLIGDVYFRVDCIHGQTMISQNVLAAPKSPEERRGLCLRLGRDYVKLYGCFPDWAHGEGVDRILAAEFPHAVDKILAEVHRSLPGLKPIFKNTRKTPNAGLLPIGDVLPQEIPL